MNEWQQWIKLIISLFCLAFNFVLGNLFNFVTKWNSKCSFNQIQNLNILFFKTNEEKIEMKKLLNLKKKRNKIFTRYACYVYFAACVYDETYFESVCLHRDTSIILNSYKPTPYKDNSFESKYYHLTWSLSYNGCDPEVEASQSHVANWACSEIIIYY